MKTPIELACDNAYKSGYEAAQPKWIKVDKEFAKNFIGYAWVNFENPFTGSNDIAFRFMSKRSDFVFATHIMQVEKPSPPKTTDNDNP